MKFYWKEIKGWHLESKKWMEILRVDIPRNSVTLTNGSLTFEQKLEVTEFMMKSGGKNASKKPT